MEISFYVDFESPIFWLLVGIVYFLFAVLMGRWAYRQDIPSQDKWSAAFLTFIFAPFVLVVILVVKLVVKTILKPLTFLFTYRNE